MESTTNRRITDNPCTLPKRAPLLPRLGMRAKTTRAVMSETQTCTTLTNPFGARRRDPVHRALSATPFLNTPGTIGATPHCTYAMQPADSTARRSG